MSCFTKVNHISKRKYTYVQFFSFLHRESEKCLGWIPSKGENQKRLAEAIIVTVRRRSQEDTEKSIFRVGIKLVKPYIKNFSKADVRRTIYSTVGMLFDKRSRIRLLEDIKQKSQVIVTKAGRVSQNVPITIKGKF